MQLINGILFHAVGASSASMCYVPEKKLKGWSWQTYWLSQAFVCWLLLPLAVAWLTIPSIAEVLTDAPSSAMWSSFLLGMAYGVGGTAFGMAIRYVGFSLTYAIAVGISCVLGTLLPPILNGSFSSILSSKGSSFIITGVLLGAMGIAICGIAGKNKEADIRGGAKAAGFSLAKGLPLCLLAGILSAFYGFALNAGKPIAETAARYGAGYFQQNIIYIFSNSGAFFSTLLYCIYLHKKQKTFREFTGVAVQDGSVLGFNYLMAMLTGLLWYGQFFFYGLGHLRLGEYQFSSWAIHMIMLVLFSALTGLLMKEWKASSARTIRILILALSVLILAVLILTYGNYLGSSPSGE